MSVALEKLKKAAKPNKHEFDFSSPVITRKDAQDVMNSLDTFGEPEIDRIVSLPAGSQERNEFYHKISKIEETDHKEIRKVKKNIKKLIDQEIEFLGFQNQLKEEEKLSLIDDAYKQVDIRQNFFYSYDRNKVNTNKKMHDINAPGNKHRKVSYICPHEHVHPQHQIDAKSLTEDDIEELYALYTYLIDLHISQVRREVKDLNYIPPQFNQISTSEFRLAEHTIENKVFDFYHRWREPTRTWRSQTQEIDYQKELAALPINHHPDPKATTNNDVEWKEDQKFPHVANRLGYPILAESPIEKILGFERAPAHPSYQLQAFVQIPSMDPDPSLNFEKAETIYENHRIGEWIRMWRWIFGCTLPFWPAFYTFEMYQADGAPSLQWLSDAGFGVQVPLQFQDSGDWNLEKIRYCDEHDYMNFPYMLKRSMLRPTHTMYQLIILAFLQNMSFDYATKVVYNKDKDMVFVYKPDGIFSDKEYFYEVHHLETMVPPVTAYSHMGAAKKDGITTLHCMDTKDEIRLYNDPKYWNLELRDDFLSQTRSMWHELSDRYTGRVIQINHTPTERETLLSRTIEREIDEAVLKHGEIEPVVPHEAEMEDRLHKRRKRIAEAAL